jgi:hypothetical protein
MLECFRFVYNMKSRVSFEDASRELNLQEAVVEAGKILDKSLDNQLLSFELLLGFFSIY